MSGNEAKALVSFIVFNHPHVENGEERVGSKDHGFESRETWELEVVCSEAWLQSGKKPESQAHLISTCVKQR